MYNNILSMIFEKKIAMLRPIYFRFNLINHIFWYLAFKIAISVKIQMLFKVYFDEYVCKNDKTDKIINSIILYFGFTYV